MATPRKRPLILVVDDDKVLLKMVKPSLKKHGYDVATATTGKKGFEAADKLIPDLIVLDVKLPDITGYDVMSRIRSSPLLLFTPVIFCSSLADPAHRLHGFSLGADDYLTKPFQLEELPIRIARSLGRRAEIEPQLGDRSTSASSILSGSIADIGLSSVFLLLDSEGKTGILKATSETHSGSADFVFGNGSVLTATRLFPNGQIVKNQEAIYDVLTWSDGTFEFTPGDIDAENEIQQQTAYLLMEAARRLDELQVAAEPSSADSL
jgi:DNA-binding response OmpR family regulator